MTHHIGKFTIVLASVVLTASLTLFSSAGPVLAQTLEQKIEDALKSKAPPPLPAGVLSRGITSGGPAQAVDPKMAQDQKFIGSLRSRSISVEATQSVAPEERAKIAEIVQNKPKIDLEIFFDYNSADIGPRAVPSLVALGNVLSKGAQQGTVFLINGYTDGRGDAQYNQGLSERRANAVRRMLIQHYKLAPDTLIAVGFGKEQLKNPANPFADENRRVQIVNTEVKSAGR